MTHLLAAIDLARLTTIDPDDDALLHDLRRVILDPRSLETRPKRVSASHYPELRPAAVLLRQGAAPAAVLGALIQRAHEVRALERQGMRQSMVARFSARAADELDAEDDELVSHSRGRASSFGGAA
jgi:hypothetical protein